MMKRRTLMTSALVLALFGAVPAIATAGTLDDIKARGTLRAAVRCAPPLIIEESEIDWAVDRVAEVLDEFARAEAHS